MTMKTIRHGVAMLFWGLASTVAAAGSEGAALQDTGCTALMTDQECRTHLATLASMPKGQARESYLIRHRALLAERHKACRCQRTQAAMGKAEE